MKDTLPLTTDQEAQMRSLVTRLEADLRKVPALFGGTVPLVSLRVILRFDRRTGSMIATSISPEYEEKFSS
jgi:hypothetical protein